jgi:hypothetical protein
MNSVDLVGLGRRLMELLKADNDSVLELQLTRGGDVIVSKCPSQEAA